ncbi:MAG: hypothetical protein ABFC80_08160, partial [Coriobacteriales bacterium]
VILRAAQGNGLIDTNVLLLPVGIGLLTANRSARAWAAFLAGLTGVASLAAAVLVLFGAIDTITLPLLGLVLTGVAMRVAFALVSIAVSAACVAAVWMLYTPPVSDTFSARGKRNGEGDQEREATTTGHGRQPV